jgi:integrase
MTENRALTSLLFVPAAKKWQEDNKPYWKPNTHKSYSTYINRLMPFFHDLRLLQIHIGHFREYQKWRSEDNSPQKVCPASINHDLNTLAQILNSCGLWESLEKHYKPLPLPGWRPPRVLSEMEEERFFEFAANDEECSLAYWVASLTNNTSASGTELRHVQILNVSLDTNPPILYVPSDHVKNEFRARVIALNDVGEKQVRRIMDRAYQLGSCRPEHYIFPFRVNGTNTYDPMRPASPWFLYRQWDKLVTRALELGIISFKIRPHDMRHQIITKLLENGTPEQTVMSIAGHVSRQMLEYYSHNRVDAKYRALMAISPNKKSARRIGVPRKQKRA